MKGKVDPSQGLYLPYLAVRDAVPGLYLHYLAVRDAVPGLYLLYLAVEEVDLGLHLLCRMAREVLSLSLAERGALFPRILSFLACQSQALRPLGVAQAKGASEGPLC